MNSNRKSRERTTDDLRHVEPYKRSTKDKQAWRSASVPAQHAKWDEAA